MASAVKQLRAGVDLEKDVKKDNYEFSIIVPVYNVQNDLERCIQSLIYQKSAEILLVNDGSTDQSGAICDRYACKYTNVKVLHKENGGLSSARNYGVLHSIGKYLIFVDSDDYVEKKMCETLLEIMKEMEAPDVVTYNAVEEIANKSHYNCLRKHESQQPRTLKGYDFLLERYKKRDMNIQAWMYAWNREFWGKNSLRFKEGILHEDVEFTPRALLKAMCILEVPSVFYHYVVRENSISTQKDKSQNIRDLFDTLNRQIELAEQQNLELKKWMKNAALNSYLNMVYEARMYQPQYRGLLDKRFLLGKAATNWNRFRAMICFLNVRLYCWMNDCYKKCRHSAML